MILYRYEDTHYSSGSPILHRYIVSEETPKGYWINRIIHESDMGILQSTIRKWMSKNARRRFAYETEEDAMYSYFRRKNEQHRILKQQYKKVEKIMEYLLKEEFTPEKNIFHDGYVEEARYRLLSRRIGISDYIGFIKSDEMKI